MTPSLRARVALSLGAILVLAAANVAAFVWANARRDAALAAVLAAAERGGDATAVSLARAVLAQVERVTVRVGITVFGTSTAVAAALAVALSLRLTVGLAHLRHGARVIGRGNLAYRIRSASRDEIGDLAAAFNEMAEELQTARLNLETARAAAEAASHAKGAFLAHMSHELRTPLNAIIGYSEILREDAEVSRDERLAADLDKIRSAGAHLLAMINEVLDLAAIEAGKVKLRVETFAVAPLVREVAAAITPLARENGNTMRVAAAEIGTMRADATKVRQVLFNLLGNACKFAHEATISLAAERVEDGAESHVVFTVGDTGPGMTPEQLAVAFREFEQGGAGAPHAAGGTGLGLTISRRLCELMGGELLADSAPGQGTTFRAVIPAETKAG